MLINSKIKDSVFTFLFSQKEYTLETYKELHPEDTSVTSDDIRISSINNIFTRDLYNDIGFIVRDKLIVLMEAQSTWNPNMPLRLLLYLAETYKQYINDKQLNVYSKKQIKVPKPEFYLIYTGEDKTEPPDYMSIRNCFESASSMFDLKVRVFSKANTLLIGQYVVFSKVITERYKMPGDKASNVRDGIEYCIDHNVLKEFLSKHNMEVCDMITTLFDEIFIREAEERERQLEFEAKLKEIESKSEAKLSSALKTLVKLGCSKEEIMHELDIDSDEFDKLASSTSYVKGSEGSNE